MMGHWHKSAHLFVIIWIYNNNTVGLDGDEDIQTWIEPRILQDRCTTSPERKRPDGQLARALHFGTTGSNPGLDMDVCEWFPFSHDAKYAYLLNYLWKININSEIVTVPEVVIQRQFNAYSLATEKGINVSCNITLQ
ncbi:hypothetical protein CEXT_496431 [Caerostris extrusa]|uniref:Uncharacterized protein n=1 Tax=Caerostris extrusa TaxID=172846 RepID=A0AAV4R7S3_CAEEX|nr:hypothetical protein CEXT_496431 [Caerostris extrusa]